MSYLGASDQPIKKISELSFRETNVKTYNFPNSQKISISGQIIGKARLQIIWIFNKPDIQFFAISSWISGTISLIYDGQIWIYVFWKIVPAF